MCRLQTFFLSLIVILMALPASSFAASETDHEEPVKIGVVALRGPEQALAKWSPTAKYLGDTIPGYRFEIVPVALKEMASEVRERRVDFVLTNTGSYVELEASHGITRIATLNALRGGEASNYFGAVVFTRADRADINNFSDLHGRRFMAVARNSFGGFQMAWRELNDAGIDPFSDFSEMLFAGFPQDGVVYAVRDGRADAGTVRTGILESLAAEGKINLDDFKILNPRDYAGTSGFPLTVSSRLYPEWAFAKTRHISSELARSVALRLLEMSPDHPAAVSGKYGGWTIPVSYRPVHDLFKDLDLGPHAMDKGEALLHVLEDHWYWLAAVMPILGFIFVYALALRRLAAKRGVELSQADERLEEQETDRRRVEEISARFGRILEDSSNEIYVFDAETLRFVQVNRGARDNLGYSMKELKQLTAYDIKPYYDLEKFQEAVAPLRYGTESLLIFETVHERKDGSTYDVEVQLQLYRDDSASLFVAIIQDITDRKRAEEISNRFGRILEDSSNEIYVFDAETLRFVQVNRGARDNLGYTMAELEQFAAYDIKPDYDWETFEEIVRPLRDGKENLLTYETIHARKDGSTYPVEVRLQLYDENKTSLFIAIIQDITDRKRAEDNLQNRNRLLGVISDAQQHFIGMDDEDEIFGTLLKGFVNVTESQIGFIAAVLHTAEGPHLQIRSTHNVSWTEETGLLGDQSDVHDHELFGADSIFGGVVADGEPAIENGVSSHASGRKLPDCCRDMRNFMGVPIHLGQKLIGVVGLANHDRGYEWEELVQLEPLISTSGHLLDAWRGAERRIEAESEIRRLNADLEERVADRTSALKAANDNLHETLDNLQQTQEQLVQSEKMASLGGLVAGVAHEINTPLGVGVTAASHLRQVSTDLQRALEGGQLKRADLEKFLRTNEQSTDIILTNLRRAADLVRSFKQVAVDQSSEEMRLFSLREYLDEVLTSLRPNLKRTKHRIEVDCTDDLSIMSFPGAISQVVTNLVMNSVLHAYDEGDRGHIRITAVERQGRVELVYSDDGKGITQEDLKRIYDPFFTTARNRGGSGLGLNILYNIVTQKLGGTINCTSEPGKGVEFTIGFPVALGAVA